MRLCEASLGTQILWLRSRLSGKVRRLKDAVSEEPLGGVGEDIACSFWFLLTLMTVGSVGLFLLTQQLDRIAHEDLTRVPMLPVVLSGGTNGAAAMIGVIAGSLITVMTTAFSVTIVALQLASSNYSPRLLRSFSKDRGVQVVLGGFVATFVYSLLVLRAISAYKSGNIDFSPAISVTAAVSLALVCVGLIIFFIQHSASLIQSSNIVRRAHHDTMQAVEKLEDYGKYAPQPPEGSLDPAGPASSTGSGEPSVEVSPRLPVVVRARKSGYLKRIKVGLIARAMAADKGTTVVEFLYGPGYFVPAGSPVAKVWRDAHAPSAAGTGSGSEDAVLRSLILGSERSLRQDFAFGLQQLSEISLKGLSPGLNDPTTTIQALDRLEAVFIALGSKALPPHVWVREVRGRRMPIKVAYPDFDELVGIAFDQTRRAALETKEVAVLQRYLKVIGSLLQENTFPERELALWNRVFSMARMAPSRLPDPQDAVDLVCQAVGLGARLLPKLPEEHGAKVDSDLEEFAAASKGLRGGERIQRAVDAARRFRAPDEQKALRKASNKLTRR